MIREPPGETDREDAADAGQHPVCRGGGPPRHQGFVLFNSTHVEAIAPITMPAAGC